MRTRATFCLFVTHVALLLLAATNVTVVSWMWSTASWTCNFYSHAYRDGWGYRYVSDYSLLQVVLYLAAYTSGLLVLAMIKQHRTLLGGLAAIVCVLGTASFALELTHWAWDHNLSWIASFPAVLAVLWVCIGVQAERTRRLERKAIAV